MAAGPVVAWALAQALALGSGIEVVAVPPDTRCPPRLDLARAVATRVPDDLAGWVAWYRVEARLEPPVENHVTLELRDATGGVRLRRELAILDDGCAAAAEGMALILERFFEKVAWTASVPLPEVENADVAEPEAGRRWELQIAAGGRREVAFAPALALDVRASLSRSWLAAAGIVLQPVAVADPTVTQVELASLPLRLSVRRVLVTRPVAFELGPAGALVVERAQAMGVDGSARYRVVGTAGAVVAARRALGPSWAVSLEVNAELSLPGAEYTVNGLGEVLRPAPLQVTGMLGIARALAR
jgi:hypothetical protein